MRVCSTRSSSSPTARSSTSRSRTRSSSSPRWADRGARRTRASPAVHRRGKEDHHLHDSAFPFTLEEIGSEHRGRRFAIIIDEAHSSQGGTHLGRGLDSDLGVRGRGGRRDHRGPDQPADGGEEAPAQRQLLRLHRHAQEQDPRDLRRAGTAAGRQGQALAVPQLYHEAGNPGGLHPGRAPLLHAGRELLQARQESRGRS